MSTSQASRRQAAAGGAEAATVGPPGAPAPAAPVPVAATTAQGRPAWLLRTARTAMLLSVGDGGELLLDHWGPTGGDADGEGYLPEPPPNRPSRSHFVDGVPLAYTVYGERSFKEPCLCTVYADGTRITRLTFVGSRIQHGQDPQGHGEDAQGGHATLALDFADPVHGLEVTHHFTVHPEHDLVVRGVTLTNAGTAPVTLERALTAALGLPPDDYEAWTLHGRWGGEFGLTRRALPQGTAALGSRRGVTSKEATPWFAVTRAGQAGEQHGDTWFGALAWSGNWTITCETERNGALHVVAGIEPFDAAWHQEPGERFETPTLVCGFSADGLGGASRALHRYQVAAVLPARHRDTLRPIHYNSWFATTFDVRADHQAALARRAADLGAELFVVDDGWFAGRTDDHAGLGDWVADPRKFPDGLGPLAAEVHRLGMQFGIWVEPEMVNPDSDLYRAHPDWVLHVPPHEPVLVRNQLVLNFARDDVRAGVHAQLRRLLTDHPVDFLKWDHNRPHTDAGWPGAPPGRAREVWVRHTRGVYEVMAALRQEFPDLLVESCASGGGRADLGILRYTDQVWVSDNTDPADRLASQYGYSHAYAARTMVSWVTDTPNPQTGRVSPLAFRFHVAMQGVLGLGGDLLNWTDAELAEARDLVAQYRRIRPTVQHGDQYWVVPPSGDGLCAVQYVSPDRRETVVLAYQVRGAVGEGLRRVRLRGLDPAGRYQRVADGARSTGAALMAAGVPAFGRPPDPLHTADWRSRLEHWRVLDDLYER